MFLRKMWLVATLLVGLGAAGTANAQFQLEVYNGTSLGGAGSNFNVTPAGLLNGGTIEMMPGESRVFASFIVEAGSTFSDANRLGTWGFLINTPGNVVRVPNEDPTSPGDPSAVAASVWGLQLEQTQSATAGSYGYSSAPPGPAILTGIAGSKTGYRLLTFALTATNPGSTTVSVTNPSTLGVDFVLNDNMTFIDPLNASFTVNVVPEPSSMALAGLAVAGGAFRFFRRKKAVVTTEEVVA